jgi:hypothetical protein
MMKSLLMGTRRYLYKVYNYHDSRACGYKRSGILFWLDGFGWEWGEIGQNFVGSLWLLCAFVAILWDILKYNLIGVVLTYNFNYGK